jgi:peroxiredoxin Q/BCP
MSTPIMQRAGRLAALVSLTSLSACPGLTGARTEPIPAAAPVAPTLDEGAAAPDGSAVGPTDKIVRISDFRGKPLILYFYPVDFGSSATAEAEEFKSDHARYKKLGVSVVGVSTDDVNSHRDFAARFKLPFLLLSDHEGALARAFGVPLEAGTTRHYTFFVDRHGVIRKVWRNVRAWGHSSDVLTFAKTAAK